MISNRDSDSAGSTFGVPNISQVHHVSDSAGSTFGVPNMSSDESLHQRHLQDMLLYKPSREEKPKSYTEEEPFHTRKVEKYYVPEAPRDVATRLYASSDTSFKQQQRLYDVMSVCMEIDGIKKTDGSFASRCDPNSPFMKHLKDALMCEDEENTIAGIALAVYSVKQRNAEQLLKIAQKYYDDIRVPLTHKKRIAVAEAIASKLYPELKKLSPKEVRLLTENLVIDVDPSEAMSCVKQAFMKYACGAFAINKTLMQKLEDNFEIRINEVLMEGHYKSPCISATSNGVTVKINDKQWIQVLKSVPYKCLDVNNISGAGAYRALISACNGFQESTEKKKEKEEKKEEKKGNKVSFFKTVKK